MADISPSLYKVHYVMQQELSRFSRVATSLERADISAGW